MSTCLEVESPINVNLKLVSNLHSHLIWKIAFKIAVPMSYVRLSQQSKTQLLYLRYAYLPLGLFFKRFVFPNFNAGLKKASLERALKSNLCVKLVDGTIWGLSVVVLGRSYESL